MQIARAFTGWTYDDTGNAFREEFYHDFMSDFDGIPPSEPNRGPKVIYKSTGQFGPAGKSFTVNGEGPAEIDTVIDTRLTVEAVGAGKVEGPQVA